tara:strand:+ start:9817 stop:11226 length:1410 start_codon:yes stop_codon:yes gene_type:complete
MAITTSNFNSSDYVLSSSKRVITCTSTNVTQFKYRFYLEVIYDSKTYAYTFRPNDSSYGLIDISSIINTLVYPINTQQVLTVPDSISATGTTNLFQQNLHSMPHTINDTSDRDAYLSTGGSGVKKIDLKLWDFYALTSDVVPTKQGSAVDGSMYLLTGYNKSTDLINFDFSDYKLDGASKSFLNGNYNDKGTYINIDAALTDYGTLAILNRTTDVNTAADGAYRFLVQYYNTADVLTDSQYFLNTTDFGGKYDAAGVSDDSMIIHFGCYPANLDKLDAAYDRPQDQADLSYYEVYSVASDGSQSSRKYRFNMVNRCDKYDSQRFAYINKFGVWEYITFNKERTDKINNTKTEIKSSIYNYNQSYATITAGYNELPFVPGVAHESRRNIASNVKQSFTIKTGYLKDHEIEQVKDMFISSAINYINEDGTALAVILTDKSIEEVAVSHKYEQTEYRLRFEYSIETYNPILF